jgi:hypothetical protein
MSLIVPTEHVAGPLPDVATLAGPDAGITGFVFGSGSEAVRFDDRGFSVERR